MYVHITKQFNFRIQKITMKLISSFVVFILITVTVRYSHAFGLINGGHYRVQSMEDGLYLTAAYPDSDTTSAEEANLGEITSEKWVNSREQRWDVIAFNKARSEYWLFSQENTFNRLTAAFEAGRPTKHVTELIAVGKNRYVIRSTIRDACLVNPGRGLKIFFAICNISARNQHWEFDLLTKQ